MYELRVLNGLHRGAALPLDEQPHVIGASEDADVVLVDEGIAEKHATLTLTDTGWLLTSLDGNLSTADSNQPQSLIELAPGDFARLGGVWLTVVDQDARWENPPPEPTDDPHFNAAVADDDDPMSQGDDMPAQETYMAQEGEAATETDAEAVAKPAAAAAAGAKPAVVEPPLWRRILSRRVVLIPLSLTIVSAAAAYAITSKPDPTSSKKMAEHALQEARLRSSADPGARAIGDAYVAANPDAAPSKPLTPAELRKAFRKRLADADLLPRFDLNLQDHQWQLKAALDEEETARFERILNAFVKQHNIKFPIQAQVGNNELMLPFKIRQVISGTNASVVTSDGSRLYVGDELKGVRLVSIQGDKLTFAGKRTIEVTW